MSDALRSDGSQDFDMLKSRLDEIVGEVAREDISLDDALALYEEAVNIGLAACDASESVPSDSKEEAAQVDAFEGDPAGEGKSSEPHTEDGEEETPTE